MKKILYFVISVVSLTVLFTDCTKAANKHEVSISFIGDVIMHIPVKTCARINNIIDPETKKSLNNEGFDFLFDKIRSRLSSSDLTLANMEFPVAAPYTSKPFIFNCEPGIVPAMKNAGISAVTIANNHILDQGQEGAVSTIELLKANAISYIGAGLTADEAKAGMLFTEKEISVGLLAATGVLNWPIPKKEKVFINLFYNEDRMIEQITAMKQKSEYIILVVHTGVEYLPMPEEKDRTLMKKYLDAGVDLIIGHHPHITQPIETYTTIDGRETCIFYSLGNFISNQSSDVRFPPGKSRLSTRNGLIVTAKLKINTEDGKDVLNAEFDIIHVKTVNERETVTRKRRIQTEEFAETETKPPVYILTETILNGKPNKSVEVLDKKIVTKKTYIKKAITKE